jgi:two-component system, chemotaxis family, response regulator Rcp1
MLSCAPRALALPAALRRCSRMHSPAPPIEILLVEDNPGDVRLTLEALRESRIRNHLSVARDGAEALAFLHRETPFSAAPRPDLILLDLNLPSTNGREVLAAVKSNTALKTIPVIVLTTSADRRDVADSYALHANAYVVKPVDFDAFLAAMRSIEDFWLKQARLPFASP